MALNQEKSDILVIGCGYMALEYHKVLQTLGYSATYLGRGKSKADLFFEKTGVHPLLGGIESVPVAELTKYKFAINSVNIENLYTSSVQLLKAGIKFLLIEKPGALELTELKELQSLATAMNAKVFIAYNRRFYSSVAFIQNYIRSVEPVESFHFEFTEWTHLINPEDYSPSVMKHWLLSNSSHVIDLAFHLGGWPSQMAAFSKETSVNWADQSNFVGSGISEKGALFSYQANWIGPGRWSVEIITKSKRFFLKPMEKLFVQNSGSVNLEEITIDNQKDLDYKPGLYQMVQSFLSLNESELCTLENQIKHFEIYSMIMTGKHRLNEEKYGI
ncbi:hypothetical protein LPTSP4_03050 [Leptospira ryugenii]|uniref:Oxidoreductase, NAD-binding domain protein n=1 Tax=Leptospira ryugenii TaxID=1917863 RepID=A0A2P2DVZ9_9LEPT|nr:myo-inositol 2-dehydrogenase [Leptospira ryugenii]GBF48805.1 hypothetical protein LPTSP4_03050 [Leptospira ryugenii]